MKKNNYVKINDSIYRILAVDADKFLVLDCNKRTMPVWKQETALNEAVVLGEEEAYDALNISSITEELKGDDLKKAHARYTMIAGILTFLSDDVSEVYLVDDDYTVFSLIERHFSGKSLEEVLSIKQKQKAHTKSYAEEQLQAKIELASHIEAIAAQTKKSENTEIKYK